MGIIHDILCVYMLEHMVCMSATSNGSCDCSKVTACLGPIFLELGIFDIHYLFHCEAE